MPIKYDLVERSVFDLLGAGNGQGTPEIDPILSFHTTSVDSRSNLKYQPVIRADFKIYDR
jgi:hypothetical protein